MLTRLKAKSEGKLAKQLCRVVLDQFDKQYSKELGDCWSKVRDVLISPSLWQYAVLFNRFSYPSELEKTLLLRGYHTVLQDALPHYPKSMKCYLSRTADRMPSERHQPGRLKTYYLLNAASLLPVLALEVKDGETVLDLCAAPGGKSIALLQCAYPGYLLCNEYDRLRGRWLRQTLESFIPQPLRNVIKVSELDGREVGDAQPATFDKVLVDAPCSNDRSWLFSSDSQKATYRICQRNNLPALQVGLLRFVPGQGLSLLFNQTGVVFHGSSIGPHHSSVISWRMNLLGRHKYLFTFVSLKFFFIFSYAVSSEVSREYFISPLMKFPSLCFFTYIFIYFMYMSTL
nr:tRNA (cytosine(34)-C(5))-methyltransferase, mitochondrial isoform X5 [Rattus norvegicus]